MKYDVAVIGAGITGLTAAYKLSRKGYKVIVLEKANRVGGNITTKEVNLEGKKYLIEEGPQTILANNRAVWELINELGLKPQKASPYSEKRYIYKNGKLIPIPLKPLEFFKTPLVSFKAKLQLFKELFVKPSQKEDESVAKFTIRHFGREFLDYFVQPFVSGIYAGDAEKLSVRYAFPKLYEIERKYGSLLKAFIKEKRVSPKGDLISFPKGLKEFTDALAEKVKVELNTEVETISKNPSLKLYEVRTNQKTYLAKKIVVTTPAYQTAEILKNLFPPIEELKEINYPPVGVVSVAFPKIGLEGFGFLAPKRERLKILGAIYVSSLFPNRCPEDEDCLTIFTCGETLKAVCGNKDWVKLTLEEIKKIFPQIGDMKILSSKLWERSIPQYEVGYGKYYALVEEFHKRYPDIKVISNFVGGSSLAKCIEKGWNVNFD